MKVLITNIVFNDKIKEWNVTLDKLKAYNDYITDEHTDKSLWNFNDFMSFGNDTDSDDFILEVPYNNLMDNIVEIDNYAKQKVKERTLRDVKSLSVREI